MSSGLGLDLLTLRTENSQAFKESEPEKKASQIAPRGPLVCWRPEDGLQNPDEANSYGRKGAGKNNALFGINHSQSVCSGFNLYTVRFFYFISQSLKSSHHTSSSGTGLFKPTQLRRCCSAILVWAAVKWLRLCKISLTVARNVTPNKP